MPNILGGLSGVGAVALGWGTSLLFWALLLFIGFSVFVFGLWINRNRRFVYPCIEITGLGQGKVSIYVTKAGWFKKKKIFFGLIDKSGEQELICKDGKRKIFCASSVDYHEINGKRGLICKRKDDDPDVLVPLHQVEIENLQLLARIAPADYRDAAVDILEQKRKETMGWWEKNSPLIITIGVFIFGLIALIVIFNFAKTESAAWRDYAQSIRGMSQVVINSSAP